MKKIKFTIFVLTIAFALSLSSCAMLDSILGSGGDGSSVHICKYGEWNVVTEATCTAEGERTRECTICGEVETQTVKPTEHKVQTVLENPSSCTVQGRSEYTRCAVCKTTLTQPTTLPLTPHEEVIIPATDSKTEGKKCGVCNIILVSPTWVYTNDFANPESYDGSYAYEYLAGLSRGEALTAFYKQIDAVSDAFHVGDISADTDGKVAELAFSDLGLTAEEAIGVWVAYRYDRPLYYWIATNISYTDKILNLFAYEEYVDNSYRTSLNGRIYAAAEEYVNASSDASDVYEITLAFHNAIILDTEYARTPAGTPEDEQWAHSIVGIVEQGRGVCEAYAELFQLLLNYCDIENAYITGSSRGEGHAWNAVKLDDGKWYWYDLTWDDTPTHDRHVSYNYFCVSSDENVGWQDGNYVETSETFVSGHTPDATGRWGVDFAYTIPKMSTTPYSGSEHLMKKVFKQDSFTYSICNPGQVQLVWIDKEGDVTVPDTVTYGGRVYTVSAIGALKAQNGKAYGTGAVSDRKITSVHIGKNVELVWYFALNLAYRDTITGNTYTALASITVDDSNPYYDGVDGVLYEEDGDIVWIPKAISGDISLHNRASKLSGGEYDEISFSGCGNITSIKIFGGVESISATTLNGCKSLKTIYYSGTVEQWNTVSKALGWDTGLSLTVICSNGKITVS